MNHSESVALLAAALFGASISASAGTVGAFDFSTAPAASTVVAPISDQVTYAKPGETLKTFIGFNVGSGAYLLKNVSGNTINDITITFTATVTDGAEKLKLFDTATYLAGLPAGCTYPTGDTNPLAIANPLTITCKLRQFKAGDSFPAFTVFYEAPAKVTNDVADAAGTDQVKLDIRVVYAEGTSGGNPRPNSVVNVTDGGVVTLGTENPTLVRSAVPKAGSTLFTGVGVTTLGAVATASDPWTTTVIVPANFTVPTGNYTLATIEEASTPTGTGTIDCTLASNLSNCSSTTLTIPGSFAKLIIFLRRDASTLVFPNKPNEINSAKVFYSLPAQPDPRVMYPLDVPACTDTTYGVLPQIGIPCIKARKRYTNSNSPTPSTEWLRDWEFEIWALDNGKYAQ